MANDTKARAIQLIRTDDKVSGTVRFYDRREADVNKAFIGEVDVTKLPREALIKAAVHGLTQNILDSSNKLSGDDRVAFIKKACTIVQNGGWSSAPIDEDAAFKNAVEALVKLNVPRDVAEKVVTEQRAKLAS